MQITWPWPPVGRFSHDLITLRQKERWTNIKLWNLCEFDCLHFAQYISISPHGIDCKQTWCKRIYHMNRASWLNPLIFMWSQLIEYLDIYGIQVSLQQARYSNILSWISFNYSQGPGSHTWATITWTGLGITHLTLSQAEHQRGAQLGLITFTAAIHNHQQNSNPWQNSPAAIIFPTSLHLFMSCEWCVPCEALATNVASVWPLSCMGPLVPCQVRRPTKTFLTQTTLVRFLPYMNTLHMSDKAPLFPELRTTVRAHKLTTRGQHCLVRHQLIVCPL